MLQASLAAYISAAAGCNKHDRLVSAECWDYLRDVLLLILTGEPEGIDEPLALLVASSICLAMLTLVLHADEASCTSIDLDERVPY